MAETGKDEMTTEISQQKTAPQSIKDIYSAIVSARNAGESEYGIKTDDDVVSGTNVVNQCPDLRDNERKEGGLAAKLTALGQGGPVRPEQRTRRERRQALAQQGEGRKELLKKSALAAGKDWSDIDSDAAKPKKKRKNVLTRMEDITGPLSLLYRSVNERLKVKVWTRSYNHIRGICTGYILAFDTHFNMAMADVDEVYTPSHPTNLTPKEKTKKKRRKKGKNALAETQNGDGTSRPVTPAEPVTLRPVTPTERMTELDQDVSTTISAATQVDGTADSSDSDTEEENLIGEDRKCHTTDVSESSSSSSSSSSGSDSDSDDDTGSEAEDEEEVESVDSAEEVDLELMESELAKLKEQLKELEKIKTPKKETPRKKTEQVKTRSASARRDSPSHQETLPSKRTNGKARKASRERDRHHTHRSDDREEEHMDTDHHKRHHETEAVKHKKTERLESVIGKLRIDDARSKSKPPELDLRNKLIALQEARTRDKKHLSSPPEQHSDRLRESNRERKDSNRQWVSDREWSSDRDSPDRYRKSDKKRSSERERNSDRHRESDRYRQNSERQIGSERQRESGKQTESNREHHSVKRQESSRYREFDRERESDKHREFEMERHSDKHRDSDREPHSDREADRDRDHRRHRESDQQRWDSDRLREFERERESDRYRESDQKRHLDKYRESDRKRSSDKDRVSDRHREFDREREPYKHRESDMERNFEKHREPDKQQYFDRDQDHQRHRQSD